MPAHNDKTGIVLVKKSFTLGLTLIISLSILIFTGASPVAGESEPIKFDEALAVRLMLQEINRIRADEGLGFVTLDPALSEVSREHSKDMAERDYFGHLCPDGFDANIRVRRAGMNCLVSENIGVYRTQNIPLGRIVTDLMDSFYESELHRANILNRSATHVGIGFYQDAYSNTSIFDESETPRTHQGYGIIFVTQNFYRLEIARTDPYPLPTEISPGEELQLSISTISDFDALSLRFERDGFYTEEYLVQVKPKRSREYSCMVRFAEKGRWACQVIGIRDPMEGTTRGIGQMEFVVE